MKSACLVPLVLCLAPLFMWGQQTGTDTDHSTLTVRSTLVQVPVLVKTNTGRVVYELTANNFPITDNGVPQNPTLDADTGSQPLALAIVVETGGAGVQHLGDYRQLDSVLDALIGNVEHRVAVIGFDSAPHLLMPFSPRTVDASHALAGLDQGDNGAAILDGIAFAVEQLSSLVIQGRITKIQGDLVTVKTPDGYPGGPRVHAQFVTAGPTFSIDVSRARILLPDGSQVDKVPLAVGDRVLVVLTGEGHAPAPGNINHTYSAAIVERLALSDKIVTH